jgi:antitoxin component YwqK of YwqJK toxin-antitoxin module
MPELTKNPLPVFYTVCMKKYDSLSLFHGLLYEVRRGFFKQSRKGSNRVADSSEGIETHYSYRLSDHRLKWKRKSGNKVLEISLPQPDGYCILTWNMAGNFVSKASYGKNHEWQKTAYFAEDSATHPQVLLKPIVESNGICMQEYDAELEKYSKTILYACPINIGTAQQSFINSVAGEPQLCAATSLGDFCYCTQQELELRKKTAKGIASGSQSTEPIWTVPSEEPEPEPEPQMEPTPEPLPAAEPEVPVLNEQTTEPKLPAKDLSAKSYAADHELYHVDAEPISQPTGTRYTVAMKRMHGPIVHNKNLLSSSEPKKDEKAETADEKEPPGSNPLELMGAAKCIVISAEESYLYFGQIIEGLRQGRGRTQMQNGATAYEGDYKNDKRDGFGTYYYKSGKICYVGEWKENHRDGVGVSFRAGDSTIHVGQWENDKPFGTGSIFDRDGNLRYAGRIENGERQGAGIAYHAEDGTVFVGKWHNNIPTGEGSAFDRDGNLIYTGMWQNGKRHGQGTEYSPDGGIVFEGEWHEDSYFEGTLYRKIEE